MKNTREKVGEAVYRSWPLGATEEIEALEGLIQSAEINLKNAVDAGVKDYRIEKTLWILDGAHRKND